MPAYDRPMIITSDRGTERNERVGASLVFAAGVDKERAQAFIERCIERGILDPSMSSKAQEFDAAMGTPVFYIP